MSNNILRPKKRLGRMHRSKRLGIIIPVKGEEIASEGKSGAEKLKRQ